MNQTLNKCVGLFQEIKSLSINEKVDTINKIKLELAKYSPFKEQPVDCVIWVKSDDVVANDYNPNTVAPPEMRLLEQSITENGYTQPIVTWRNDENKNEVVDGFHRNRVGKECKEVKEKIFGYLPVVVINTDKTDRSDRIAATIRHNRARGKHKIQSMSEIVLELKNRNWTNERISKQLGLDEDEILRLCQITGLENLFKDSDFTKSWNIEDSEVDNFEELTEEIPEKEKEEFRTINTDDPNRIFHTHDKWECYKAGFYNTTVEGKTEDECKQEYANFLSDLTLFEEGLKFVTKKWKHSCEHYLTNNQMNRIAWLGQAATIHMIKVPAKYSGGFYLMTQQQQDDADNLALTYLNKWLRKNNRKEVTLAEARMDNKVMNTY